MGKFYLRDEDYIKKSQMEISDGRNYDIRNKSFLPWTCQKTGHVRERKKILVNLKIDQQKYPN